MERTQDTDQTRPDVRPVLRWQDQSQPVSQRHLSPYWLTEGSPATRPQQHSQCTVHQSGSKSNGQVHGMYVCMLHCGCKDLGYQTESCNYKAAVQISPQII